MPDAIETLHKWYIMLDAHRGFNGRELIRFSTFFDIGELWKKCETY